MEATHVIKKPLVTEKATYAMNEFNQYSFVVDRRASKDDVRRAVEEIYGVKVDGVTTQNRKGARRRTRYGYVTIATTKKATVRLREGQAIELF
jgi:large subunit ribosomal protein L23